MQAPVIWFEVLGKNADELRGFYSKLFNWEFKVDKPMNYGMVDKSGEGIPGGVGASPNGGGGWVTFYVQVKDLDATLKQAEKLGGKVLMPVTKLPDITIAAFADPEGHPIGLVAG